jgi:methyl coenzyme M reductase gamma subunit
VEDRPDRLKVVFSGIAVNVAGRRVRVVQFIETVAGAMDQEHVRQLIGMFRAKGFGICIARLLPSGRHADAIYEIPSHLLAEGEVELFTAALGKLDPSVE